MTSLYPTKRGASGRTGLSVVGSLADMGAGLRVKGYTRVVPMLEQRTREARREDI